MSVKGCITLENWQCPIKANVHSPGTSNSTPRFSPRRNKNVCPEGDPYEKIRNSQTLETKPIFVNKERDKQIVYIHTKDCCTAIKGIDTAVLSKMNTLKNIILSERNLTAKSTSFMVLFIGSSHTGHTVSWGESEGTESACRRVCPA